MLPVRRQATCHAKGGPPEAWLHSSPNSAGIRAVLHTPVSRSAFDPGSRLSGLSDGAGLGVITGLPVEGVVVFVAMLQGWTGEKVGHGLLQSRPCGGLPVLVARKGIVRGRYRRSFIYDYEIVAPCSPRSGSGVDRRFGNGSRRVPMRLPSFPQCTGTTPGSSAALVGWIVGSAAVSISEPRSGGRLGTQ
jgi:hypothetical protein